MAAQLSFTDRVALLHKKVNTATEGELSVYECEDGFIDVDYKGESLIGLQAKGRTEKQLIDMISAIHHACVMYQVADALSECRP